MIRRLTAVLAMAALLALVAMLILEVQRHHDRGTLPHEPAVVVKISRTAGLTA